MTGDTCHNAAREAGPFDSPAIVGYALQAPSADQTATEGDPERCRIGAVPFVVMVMGCPSRGARANLLRRLGRSRESRVAYDKAIELGGNIAEIAYPTRRRDQMEAGLFSGIVN